MVSCFTIQNVAKFAQVIACLTLGDPEALGWDLTMQLGLIEDANKAYLPTQYLPSWSPKIKAAQIPQSSKKVHWEIAVDKEKYITIEPLSVSRAEVMCGRATMIWLAVCLAHDDPQVSLVLRARNSS